MRVRHAVLLIVFAVVGTVGQLEAGHGRRGRVVCCPPPVCCPAPMYSPNVATAPSAAPPPLFKSARPRTYSNSDVRDARPTDEVALAERRAPRALAFNLNIPGEDQFEGSHRKFPKTSIVHGGQRKTFDDVNGLIEYFESPERKQEQWWGTVIKKTINERNADLEMVNVTVKHAWLYEISSQADNDYHLLIGVRPDLDEGRYINAEISAINLDSPDAAALWEVRKSFKTDYVEHTERELPAGHWQPPQPIHIRISGSIFLDADHGRGTVGHGDIKNFTSWEIHPITKIRFLQ